MDTLEFFTKILPAQGYKAIAELTPDKFWRHTFTESTAVAAQLAVRLDQAGRTVYHACSSFKEKGKRTQINAGWQRSFWIDADVDPDKPHKYATLKEAITDIARAAKELKLPLPLIVKSGRGAHAYWIFDSDVPSELWVPAAEQLKAVLASIGFRQDTTRTADSASVLRPVGTTWRKEGEREVTAVSTMEPMPFTSIVERIQAYTAEHNLSLPQSTEFEDTDNDDLGTKPEYPPSSAHQVIKFCPTLAYVAQERGNVEEPLWRGMLGIVKYCTEGDALGHEWSKGYAGYDAAETQSKLDRWSAAPTTCQYFRGSSGHQCTGCTREVTSPISLGYVVDEAQAPANPDGLHDVSSDDSDVREGTDDGRIPYWPKGFNFVDGIGMSAAVKDDEGAIHWVPFCDTLVYPEKRVRGEDGVWYLEVKHYPKDKKWRTFQLPSELIGSQFGMAPFLAAHEVFVTGKNGVAHLKNFFREYVLGLQQHAIEQITYSKLGWEDEYESFILGNKRIRQTQTDTVLCGEAIKSAEWNSDFGTAGTAEEWVSLVDQIYNRPGAEPYQFVIAAGFAAPLVKIVDVDNWNGIPIALTGETSLGKSTVCKVAASIYGNPKVFFLDASTKGSTLLALITRIGLLRHTPVIFDELTKRDEKEVQDMLLSLSNGKPRDRLTSSGILTGSTHKWATVSFITSNNNLTEMLAAYDKAAVAEATQMRIFEIPLESDFSRKIWGDTNAVDLIEHKLLHNYGVIGQQWLQYIIEHRLQLRDEIRNIRSKYDPTNKDETRERFYRDLVATTLVALKHATRLGWLKFDLTSLVKWSRGNVTRLRSRRQEMGSSEGVISQFVSSLYGRIIFTKRFRDGRGKANIEAPMQNLVKEPVARAAIDDKVFLVTRQAVGDWCKPLNISPNWLIEEMAKAGLIKYMTSSLGIQCVRRERIVKGTGIPGTTTMVIEFEYDKVMGIIQAEPTDDKVVQLHQGANDG